MSGVKDVSDLTENNISEFISQNYDAIYKYCFWKIRNPSDAEDLTQETFFRFVKNLDSYDDKGKPMALFTPLHEIYALTKASKKPHFHLKWLKTLRVKTKQRK